MFSTELRGKDDWYGVSNANIKALGGTLFVQVRGSLLEAVGDLLYPGEKLLPWKADKVPLVLSLIFLHSSHAKPSSNPFVC